MARRAGTKACLDPIRPGRPAGTDPPGRGPDPRGSRGNGSGSSGGGRGIDGLRKLPRSMTSRRNGHRSRPDQAKAARAHPSNRGKLPLPEWRAGGTHGTSSGPAASDSHASLAGNFGSPTLVMFAPAAPLPWATVSPGPERRAGIGKVTSVRCGSTPSDRVRLARTGPGHGPHGEGFSAGGIACQPRGPASLRDQSQPAIGIEEPEWPRAGAAILGDDFAGPPLASASRQIGHGPGLPRTRRMPAYSSPRWNPGQSAWLSSRRRTMAWWRTAPVHRHLVPAPGSCCGRAGDLRHRTVRGLSCVLEAVARRADA